MKKRLIAVLAVTLGAAVTVPAALADWTLDPATSHLGFVSIKSGDVGEVHRFTELAGHIDETGKVDIEIALDSVETLIPIRNERMRELLFQTSDYSKARLEAQVDPEQLAALGPGEILQTAAEGRLRLHGQAQPVTLSVQAARVDGDTLMVAATKPLVVDAADFGLVTGVEKLRELAGLERISNAVPVSFVLTFERDAGAALDEEAQARYGDYRATIEALTEAQKEAISALFEPRL